MLTIYNYNIFGQLQGARSTVNTLENVHVVLNKRGQLVYSFLSFESNALSKLSVSI